GPDPSGSAPPNPPRGSRCDGCDAAPASGPRSPPDPAAGLWPVRPNGPPWPRRRRIAWLPHAEAGLDAQQLPWLADARSDALLAHTIPSCGITFRAYCSRAAVRDVMAQNCSECIGTNPMTHWTGGFARCGRSAKTTMYRHNARVAALLTAGLLALPS